MVPDYVKIDEAFRLIRLSRDWISTQLNGNCDAVFNYLDNQPELLNRLIINPIFEKHWNESRDLELLKSDLKRWMKEIKGILKELNERNQDGRKI